jgi:cytochrome oxidase Cu insertion factor (SCO1/SenC/PrrC family)
MDLRRKVCRPTWLLLAHLTLLLGFAIGLSTAQPVEPPAGLAEVKPAVPMPAFNLPARDGATFDSSALEGKVVVVRFWATW